MGLSCWLSIQRAFKSSLILDKWPRMRPARLRSPCAVVSAIQFSHVAKTVAFWSLQAVCIVAVVRSHVNAADHN